ncbi:MAG: alpha-galactosidase [Pseudomonadota bacterium]
MTQCWRFDTPAQTLVLASRNHRLPEVVYWSAPLDEGEDLPTLVDSMYPAPTGGTLDQVQPITVCPLWIDGFTGVQGLEIRDQNGAASTLRLRYDGEDRFDGGLDLRFADADLGVLYTLTARVYADADVLALTATLNQTGPGRLAWLSAPVIPTGPRVDEVIEFAGRWCGEFQLCRSSLAPGARLRENRLGRSAHEHFPGILLPSRGATETQGEAFGITLGQSCGHRHVIETVPDGRTQVQFGPTPGQFQGTEGTAGPLYLTRSDQGFNGVSQAFHRYLRRHALIYSEPARPRPVHYNCWEAVYFDHDIETLADLADRAAQLGVERFVLDDGWFGARNDDTTSLGDWLVDLRKWPSGLGPLIEHVHARGMSFGLWFEPEMINDDSDLARKHPTWFLGPRDQVPGRHQFVLDLAIPEVSDELFSKIDAILTDHGIDYIKWDHNRVLPFPDPRQAEALYALLSRLRAKHPGVEIETCASGGGRIDFGILKHTQRVWLSDSNDGQERWQIQRGASYFIPPEIAGSHIGPRVCHTSGRTLPIGFRAAVAGSRSMGLEMDLREFTDYEAVRVRSEIAAFKERRALLHAGRLYRLEVTDKQVLAEMHVAEDGAQFVVFSGQLQPSSQGQARPVCLSGLDPSARYTIQLTNPGDIPAPLNRGPRSPLHRGEGVTLSGTVLMHHGVQFPNAYPNTIWTLTGVRQ